VLGSKVPEKTGARKLLVSAKYPWDGSFNEKDQDYDFQVYDHIRDVIITRPWSGILWQNGRRLEKNFISSDWLVLDFDDHTLTLDQAQKNFSDYQNIIALTKSHTETNHSFRVCIPWAERITEAEQLKYNFRKNAEFYGSDLKALNAARFFWPSIAIHSVNKDGDQMEVMPHFGTSEDFEFIPLAPVDPIRRELPRYYHKYLSEGLDHSRTGRNQPLWGLSKDLFKEGYSENEVLQLISRIKCRPAYQPRDYQKCVLYAKKAIKKV